MMLKTFLAGSLLMWVGSVTALAADTGASPYAGSEKREIKALASDVIASYLQGKGMGLAHETGSNDADAKRLHSVQIPFCDFFKPRPCTRQWP